ncbi:MAG: virulence factor TspB C-terminal domain-related protein, partial [Neisseria zoodegmatis]|uniref:virulence factor TspB C-terminal domain-related protein n=1 Tax=Neisseria zoodegmatis TaxID=326523 RepID=UPI0026EE982C
DGTVSATVIPRPDLKPHSSQAPTRSSVAPSVPKSQDAPSVPSQNNSTQANTNQSHQSQQSGQNQQQQQRQDFCHQNPQSAACADMGEADYEDLEIPEEQRDLELKPLDVFSTDGTCPAPISYELGSMGSFEISYEYLCGVLRMLRPIVILGVIVSCSMFAYSAVKEI